MNINPQLLFNASITFLVAGFIVIFKGLVALGIAFFFFAIVSTIYWFFLGLFDKFESTPPEVSNSDDMDEEGKGVLKPF
tara:strand:+ start:776 stop:1012 length:237 start_codon:yes stop_codon:yes gene_type:complete